METGSRWLESKLCLFFMLFFKVLTSNVSLLDILGDVWYARHSMLWSYAAQEADSVPFGLSLDGPHYGLFSYPHARAPHTTDWSSGRGGATIQLLAIFSESWRIICFMTLSYGNTRPDVLDDKECNHRGLREVVAWRLQKSPFCRHLSRSLSRTMMQPNISTINLASITLRNW